MRTYFSTEIGEMVNLTPTWSEAKRIAKAAVANNQFPITIFQHTSISGISPHRRLHAFIESEEDNCELLRQQNKWECLDSYFSHIKPSRNL